LKNKLRNLKNIKSLLIATNNKGKLSEIKKLLPKHITFYSPKDFNLIEPVENEKTFEGNAVIKARYCAEKSKLISLSDDSGLEISVLNGDPGIYSARWAGKNLMVKFHKSPKGIMDLAMTLYLFQMVIKKLLVK